MKNYRYRVVTALGCGEPKTEATFIKWRSALDAASRCDRLSAVDTDTGRTETIPPQGHESFGSGRLGRGLTGKARVAWVTERLTEAAAANEENP